MDKQEATEFVIKEFKRQRHRNDIIMDLCQKTGASWEQAQRFVQKVEAEHRQEITAGTVPLLVMIGVVTIVAGLALGAYAIFYTMNGRALYVPGVPVPFLGNVTYGVTGVGMVLGGIVGILRSLRQLVKK
jgi:hypothetical protein